MAAKALVASLWNIEDQSTTQLMEAFYRHLADNDDKATALKSAKRELLHIIPNLSPLSDHPKPANDYHLKTGQREQRPGR